MKTAAIIAEYNPFHNGHKYQLEETKRQTGADFIVVVMSGDFVQRGIPAMYSKTFRTRSALLSGADLVIDFARCGVSLFHHMGMISQLPQFFDIAGFTAKGKDIDHSHMVKQRDTATGKILGSA